jgi:uncharacterized protein GlcG (DUF336 family)
MKEDESDRGEKPHNGAARVAFGTFDFRGSQNDETHTIRCCRSRVVTLSTSVSAQLPTSKMLPLDVAQTIAQEAMAKCRADGYKVTVLVVDGLNAPKAMIRDDGATASTTEVAKMKATATMLYNRPSGPATPPPAGTAAPPATIPGTINAQGGVPIKVGDATIGAVAVSGAPGGDKDAACATAGIAKAASSLK